MFNGAFENLAIKRAEAIEWFMIDESRIEKTGNSCPVCSGDIVSVYKSIVDGGPETKYHCEMCGVKFAFATPKDISDMMKRHREMNAANTGLHSAMLNRWSGWFFTGRREQFRRFLFSHFQQILAIANICWKYFLSFLSTNIYKWLSWRDWLMTVMRCGILGWMAIKSFSFQSPVSANGEICWCFWT